MSEAPSPNNPIPPATADLTEMAFFAVLVDGEYAGTFGLPNVPSMEPLIAGLSSNPQVIALLAKTETTGVVLGSVWEPSTRTFREPA